MIQGFVSPLKLGDRSPFGPHSHLVPLFLFCPILRGHPTCLYKLAVTLLTSDNTHSCTYIYCIPGSGSLSPVSLTLTLRPPPRLIPQNEVGHPRPRPRICVPCHRRILHRMLHDRLGQQLASHRRLQGHQFFNPHVL
jgi:hypothetical protein